MGIRITGEDIKESYDFFFENHEKLSHSDVSSAGNISRGKKEKELTR
jgi:hypothetical protein